MDVALSVGERRPGISKSGHAVQEIPTAIRLRHRRHKCLLAIKTGCRRHIGFALIGEGSGADRGFIVIVRRGLAGENMRSLVTNVANGQVYSRSDLALNGGIPLVDSW